MFDIFLTNPHAVAVMILIVIALVLFTRDNIPLETTSLVVIVMLAAGFQLFPFIQPNGQELEPSEFLLGFGHKALVAVCALMIVGEGLIRTGALEPVGRFLSKMWRRGPALSLLLTILITGFLSAFINTHPDCCPDVAYPRGCSCSYRSFSIFLPHTHGIRQHSRRYGDHHRHVHQPACCERGRRHGHGRLQHVRFRPAGVNGG